MPKKRLTPLQEAEQALKLANQGVDQGQLDALDLPTRFEAAAREANPNFGLSRSEVLAKYNAPEFSDTASAKYIDPDVRIAMADRLATGFQGVLGQAADRASAIFGRDLTAREQSANRAQTRYEQIFGEDQRQRQRAEDMADYERQKQIDRRYGKPTGTGTGLGDPETLGLVTAVMQNPAYFEQLTPSQKGSIIPFLNAGGFDFTPKNVRNTYEVLSKSAAQVKAIGDAATKLNTSGPYTSLLTGPYKKFQANRGTNEDAVKLQQLGEGLLGTLARAVGGEKGVLTDQDIARARNLIPQIGEPAAKTKTKITTLVSLINELQDRANKAYTQPIATGTQTGGTDPLGLR